MGEQRRGLLLLIETFGVDKPAASWPKQEVPSSAPHPLSPSVYRLLRTRATPWPSLTQPGSCLPQYLLKWVEAVEAVGFTFLRHQILQRSHALAFVTRHMTPAELDALPSSEQGAPAMRMRSEDRSWNRAAAVATQGASGESEASLAPPARYGPSTGPCDADAVQ